METAICVMTMARCTENRSRLPTTPRAPDFKAVRGSAPELRKQEVLPKRRHVADSHSAGENEYAPIGSYGQVDGVIGRIERAHQRAAQRLRECGSEKSAQSLRAAHSQGEFAAVNARAMRRGTCESRLFAPFHAGTSQQ